MTDPSTTHPRQVPDTVLSIVFLVLAAIAGLISGLADLVSFVFTDYCGPRCNLGLAVVSVFAIGSVCLVAFIFAIIMTVVRLRRHQRAWWVGLLGFLVVTIGGILGYVAYAAATGYLQ